MDLDLALVVVSDVDATLVDANYSAAVSAGTIRRLHDRGVPLVLCSSKTRTELESLRRAMGIDDPFIAENGAVLCVPDDYFPFDIPTAGQEGGYQSVKFGRPHSQVLSLLKRAAFEAGTSIVAMSEMTVEAISAETGLSAEAARLARQRECDEPFRVLDREPTARHRLLWQLKEAGLRVVEGGRYDHAVLGADKGLATAFLRRLYRKAFGALTLVGLGDAMNDVPFLRCVDLPIIVRSESSDNTARMQQMIPWAKVTQLPGPAGWRVAVERVLDERVRIWEGDGSSSTGRFVNQSPAS